MNSWSSGYVADIDYTYGYYNELNPLTAQVSLLTKGLAFPNVKNACELGFGQGISTLIHGASSDAIWHGTDFNPSQAAFASRLASESNQEIHLSDDSFEEFNERTDLPEFDFIGLHGIWSWVSLTNQATIVDFIKRRLKTGGVLYISYNTLPGWSTFAPMRHLMTQHANIVGGGGDGIVSKINGARGFAQKLIETKSVFSLANPGVKQKVEALKDASVHYLAHEYFNKDWSPIYFSTMVDALNPAKLSYACPAAFIDHIDSVNLTQEQQELLNTIGDVTLNQSVRDFMTNQQFRREYWIKGPQRLSKIKQLELVREQNVLFLSNRDEIDLKIKGIIGDVSLKADVYNIVLDALEKSPKTSIGILEESLKAMNIDMSVLLQALIVLMAKGAVRPAQSDKAEESSQETSDRLNARLLDHARSGFEIQFLSSPVTGGGIPVNRFDQLFILALKHKYKTTKELAKYAWDCMSLEGQQLVVKGKTIESDSENLRELEAMASDFQDKRQHLFKLAKVI